MALESTGLNLGNAVAGANFYNPGSPLAGPNGSGQFLAVVQATTTDLTMNIAGANARIVGILQNTPTQGSPANVRFSGVSKFVAGGSITANDVLMTDSSGRLVTHTSTNWAIGIALNNCAAVGIIGEALIMNMGSF